MKDFRENCGCQDKVIKEKERIEQLSLTSLCWVINREMYLETKCGAQGVSGPSFSLKYPFVVLTSSSARCLPDGNVEKGEESFGEEREEIWFRVVSHIMSALWESHISCAALGSPWKGTEPSWGDSFNLRTVPRVDEGHRLLWGINPGETGGQSLRWTKWGVGILEL